MPGIFDLALYTIPFGSLVLTVVALISSSRKVMGVARHAVLFLAACSYLGGRFASDLGIKEALNARALHGSMGDSSILAYDIAVSMTSQLTAGLLTLVGVFFFTVISIKMTLTKTPSAA